MQVIGFTISKISAEKKPSFKEATNINTNMQFSDLQKEKIDLLKEDEGIKISFRYSVNYNEKEEEKSKDKQNNKQGEVSIEGDIVLTASKEESKEIFKSWKKKDLPNGIKLPLYNVILRKCSPKAIQLEDEINLPLHLPFPQIQGSQEQAKE